MDLGETIQAFRLKKNLSVKSLSEQVGMSSSMLSQIERGTATPSVSTLRSIAAVLNVPVYRLFLSDEDNLEYVVKKSQRKIISGSDSSSFPLELLTPTAITNIESCIMTIPPFKSSSANMIAHSGEEVSYVLLGSPILETHHKISSLEEGDSVYLPPKVKHIWRNPTDTPVKVLYTVVPHTL